MKIDNISRAHNYNWLILSSGESKRNMQTISKGLRSNACEHEKDGRSCCTPNLNRQNLHNTLVLALYLRNVSRESFAFVRSLLVCENKNQDFSKQQKKKTSDQTRKRCRWNSNEINDWTLKKESTAWCRRMTSRYKSNNNKKHWNQQQHKRFSSESVKYSERENKFLVTYCDVQWPHDVNAPHKC